CLGEVNRQLLRDSSASLFVTLFYAVLHTRTGELHYANGGHPPPFRLPAGAAPESLPGRGFMVGTLVEASYETRRVVLGPGDGLFLFTDGVTEARDAAGRMLSREHLRARLERAAGADPEGLVTAVLEEVGHFSAGAPQSDDLT